MILLSLTAIFLLFGSVTSLNYDFVLAETWAPAACLELRGSESECQKLKSDHQWTLHGLWDDRPSASSRCGQDNKFNFKALNDTVVAQLTKQWFSSNLKQSNKAFWAHEYNKHGYCFRDISETATIEQYFIKGLDLLKNNNVGVFLKDAGILPGGKYDIQKVRQAIEGRLNVNVELHCNEKYEPKEKHLSEVRICMDQNFKLVDCRSNGDKNSKCNGNGKISYL